MRKSNIIKEINLECGAALESARISLGFSRKRMGEFLQISHQQIGKYEKGLNFISLAQTIHLARQLNVTSIALITSLLSSANLQKSNEETNRLNLELLKLFNSIPSRENKESVLALVRKFVRASDLYEDNKNKKVSTPNL